MCQYIYGAVCPEEGTAAAIVAPHNNTATMDAHLEEISFHIPDGKHGVIVMDQARWHCNTILKIPSNISVLFLPPYSPELNAQESVWRVMKDRYFNNRVYESAEEIAEVACQAWNSWISNKHEISSLCRREWAILY